MILALDTTHEHGSLALARGAIVLEEAAIHSPDGFGHVLFGQIAALLERHAITLAAIDCFAAASGPGSFTGVRIGLACVKGLAEACNKPVAGVSNLQALAAFGSRERRAVVIDARRGEVYAALYDNNLDAIRPEVVTPLDPWLADLPRDVEFISPDLEPSRFGGAPVIAAPRSLAGVIARIAERRLASGEALDPAALDANYVRRSDAELLWKG